MMTLNLRYLFLTTLFAGISFGLRAQTYVFAQLQGSPTMVTTGWNLNGAAAVGDTPGDGNSDNDELVLTTPVASISGGVFYAQPINLTQCQKWTADFEFRMFDGSGADGIALCFLRVPPTGFVVGDGVGIPATAEGLKVVFDTYNNENGVAADPRIEIRYGNGYHEYNPPYNTQPTLKNTAGSLNFLRSTNYQRARVTYDAGAIEVYVEGTLYLTGNYVINFPGYLGFTSSTGGSNDRNSIRNVVIYTNQAPSEAGPATIAYCSGDSVQIGTAGNPDFTYAWTPAAGLSQSNVSNPMVRLVNTGATPITQVYKVTTTLTANPNICPTADSITVTVNPMPTSTFTVSKDTACIGEAITVTYTGNMPPTASFVWNFGGATVISGTGRGPYQLSWPAAGSPAVTLSVTRYGCTSVPTSRTVTVNAKPTATFTHPVQLCTDNEATVTYTGSAPATAQYAWDFDGGTVVSGAGQGPYRVSWPGAGLKTVRLMVTQSGCASNPAQDSVRVHGYPVADFTLPAGICDGDSVVLPRRGNTVPPPAGVPVDYYWITPGATTPPYGPDPAGFIQIEYPAPGNYVIGFSLSVNGCISDTLNKNITVHAIPTSTFTATPQVCAGDSVAVQYTGTGSAAATYDWTTAPGTVLSGSGRGPLQVAYAAAGNYTVSLRVTENGCVSPLQNMPVTVNAIPTSTFDVPSGICEGQTAALTYTGTGTAGAQFDWTFSGVEVLSGTGMGPYVLGDGNLGTFPISLRVTENNCVSPITSHDFIVLPTPTAAFSGTPLIGCNPLPAQFTNLTPAQPGMTFQWTFGDGGTGTQENPLHVYANAGTFNVGLIVSNGFGCADTIVRPAYVKVTAQPVAGFELSPPKVTMDEPTIRVIDNSLFAETWSYTMGDGASYGIRSPQHTYGVTGEYEIVQVVTNSLGCSDTAVRIVEVLPNTNVFIPNAFTPNDDGVNDSWNAIISYITEFRLRIFDRWGQEVFASDNVYDGWNGKYRNEGRLMKGDMYVYRIYIREFTGNTRELTGHITLLR